MGSRRCPICGEAAAEPAPEPGASPFPFCSERCRLVDLGNWLGESYRVPDSSGAVASDDDRNEGMGST